MSEVKVSELPEASSVNDEDLVMIVQDGVNKQAKSSKFSTLDVNGTQISSGDDLDNYTTAGVYYSIAAQISASLINTPITDSGFKLIVEYFETESRIMQTIRAKNGSTSAIWVRTNTGSWGKWKKVDLGEIEGFQGLVTFNETPSNVYFKKNGNKVAISYQGENKTHSSDEVVFVLPTGCRPSKNVYFPFTINTSALGVGRIGADGKFIINQVSSTSQGRIYFNISFFAEQ